MMFTLGALRLCHSKPLPLTLPRDLRNVTATFKDFVLPNLLCLPNATELHRHQALSQPPVHASFGRVKLILDGYKFCVDGLSIGRVAELFLQRDMAGCCVQKPWSHLLRGVCGSTHRINFSTTSSRWKATIIDGKGIARQIQDEVRAEVEAWVKAGNRRPQLTAILVGSDPASATYVRNKMKAADYTGITSRTIHLPKATTEKELLGHIHGLNDDEDVDGILVQLPVPPHISERRVCNLILPRKDVDGFNVVNVGKFCSDQKAMVPATPLGVVELLRRTGIKTFGKNAVVCGRSKNVGMPMAMLLHSDGIGETHGCDATTTICHRYTPAEQLRVFTETADILIVATGIPNLITADMVKEGVVVIDIGITEIVDSKTGKRRLVGDVDFKGVAEKASYITPVPGGVGPMTVAMLMKNTLIAARKDITD